jgi:DNA (cytosine-5)-methyltransferase 1
LQKYYSQGTGQAASDPLHTLGTRDTFGLVTVEIHGTTYAIVDIGMRMLTPREQFRAQGFPDSYEITTGPDGRRFTKTEQTRMCGNSVPPVMARALAAANVPELAAQEVQK